MATTTKEYLAKVRVKTGLSDYSIAKKYDINQSNLSKYNSGKSALSETHAWLFSSILDINPAEVVANTKLEQAKISKNEKKMKFWQEQLENIKDNSKPVKIEIAQINPIVGDLVNNAQKIIDLSCESFDSGAHLLIFPELALCGYPPEDLLLRTSFISQIEIEIERIRQNIPSSMAIVFGAPTLFNGCLYNSAVLIQRAKVRAYHKHYLPNYGVFDEKRYFNAGQAPMVFECQGKRIGVVICEDAWHDAPIRCAVDQGAETLVSINASPFQIGKHEQRLKVTRERVLEHNIDFIYVNMVGGQDELVFDGGSFVINSQAELTHQLPFFRSMKHCLNTALLEDNQISTEKNIYDALVLATKDYVEKNDVFSGVVIGLSGGIDSALTLAIAVDALGSDNVEAIMMPYEYTSSMSREDAKTQAANMNVNYQEVNIFPMVSSFSMQLEPVFGELPKDTTKENLQARIRGTLLMAISNKSGKILLTTGNKSEMAVGYATLYGDMSGGFAPLKDVPKTLVYRLAKYRNTLNYIIPTRVIERPASAELAPNQIDQDFLPEYNQLDAILALFIEKKYSVAQIIQQGHDADTVKRIAEMVLNNEYKRRQSAPGPKISQNAFGKERRYPMTSKFRS